VGVRVAAAVAVRDVPMIVLVPKCMAMRMSMSFIPVSTGFALLTTVGFELAGITHGGFLGRFVV
jgi:hypothetical protein